MPAPTNPSPTAPGRSEAGRVPVDRGASDRGAIDFRLYYGNDLALLALLLAHELRTPAPGQALLEPDVVLIPQAAMRRWLQATLAAEHGIAANLEFLTPGEFVRRALDANANADDGQGDDDLDAAALRWRLYAALTDPAVLRDPALRALRAYLDGGDPLKPWSLAGELAATFEKYQAWRRDWLLAWEAGQAPRDPQAALWRRVAGGRAHRARRVDDYLRRHAGDGTAPPRGLPSRLFAFATLNVSPDVLRVIATQARVGTLHFYLPTPTRKYWGDLSTLAERLRDGEAAAFAARDGALPESALLENPLLEAWGAAGRDFVAVLGGYEVVHPSGEIDAYADPEADAADAPATDTLLQRLQRDLLHRRPLPATPFRATLDRADPSLQVHACHTRLREVQVLHDRLRALLEPGSPEGARFDPPLQPREIAVLAPDIDPYAPHIAAVFGAAAGTPDFIPYALADTSPLASEPLAEVFTRLLALPVARFGLHEVLDLLATPAIADAAGLDAVALERLRDWLQAAGARWGLDAAHRERRHAPRDDACTWAFALDRLLLGHASGSDGDIAGVAPWPELEGSALVALDALIRLLRVLARHERVLAEAMPPDQWRERLLALLDALLPRPPGEAGDQRALDRLRTLIAGFADSAAQAGVAVAVPPEVVRAHFAAVLAEADTRAPLLTGGVSFGRMVPLRLLPFRAICVLGLNDGDYPRRDPAAGLNRLTAELGTTRRRAGDRSLRDDDRFLFLQLLAAAGDVFYASYLGADPRDGSVREPSVLVAELLDVAARYHADPAAARAALVLRHPLQPFAPAAFGAVDADSTDADEVEADEVEADEVEADEVEADEVEADADATHADAASADPRRYSYRHAWHPASDAAGAARTPLPAWADAPLPPPLASDGAASGIERVSLQDLRGFLRDPSAAFLRQRLALRLPALDDSATDDLDPLAPPPTGLARHALQQAVFAACVRGDTAAFNGTDLAAHLRAQALLPAGPLGRRQLVALLAEVQPYAQAFARWRGDAAPSTRAFELDLDGTVLHGRIEEVYPHGLPRVRIGALHGPAQIAHGLDWLVASALGGGMPLVQFAELGDDAAPRQRAPIAAAQARAALASLLRLRAHGLATPLPFGPHAGWRWYQGRDDRAWDAARRQWRDERGYSEGDADAARLALRGRDPFRDDAGGSSDLADEFKAIAELVFGAVVDGRADGERADAGRADAGHAEDGA